MLKSIVIFASITRLSSAISQNLNGMATFFQHYFAGTDNLRVVSIILLLLAFVLFLFLIVILYIKSLLSFIKENESGFGSSGGGRSVEDQELEKELDKEFERDVNMARGYAQEAQAKTVAKKQRALARDKKEEEQRKKQENAQMIQFPNGVPDSFFRGNASLQEFDWKKGRKGELDELAAGLGNIRVAPKSKPLVDVLGLIINMLGRDIDVGKIAQTVRSRCGEFASEEEVIQTIEAVQNFISLANNGRFSSKNLLPSPDSALMALSNGDTGPALSLMEDLINTMVDKAAQTNMPQKRDIVFLEASNYACTFGTFASMEDDPSLAVSAFELALELSPKNVNAWSRVGDAYAKSKADSKAVWAYQNVMSSADQDTYPHQIANANQKLAQYFEKQGDMQKAAQMYQISNAYYDVIGINARLTDKEENIIGIIETQQQESMSSTVNKLLNLSKKKLGNFM